MWNITKKVKETFEKSNILPILETEDEWEIVLKEAEDEGEDILRELQEELEEVKEELCEIVPNRFHPYIENGTLNQPTLPIAVREDYLSWIQESDKAFEKVLTLATEQTEKAIEKLSENVQQVFAESLHDSVIKRLERNGDNLKLVLESGGFSLMDSVYLQFHGLSEETSNEPLTVEETIVYYEMQHKADKFHFRILTDELEWTIAFTDLTAHFYFRPGIYTTLALEEKIADLTLAAYIEQLDHEQNYWLITPEVEQKISFTNSEVNLEHGKLEITSRNIRITVNQEIYSYPLDEYHPAQFIYTDVNENPYESLDEMLLADEIIPAIFGENIHLQIQAWNTLYSDPEVYTKEINQVLSKIQLTDENEMTLSIYITHFNEHNALNTSILAKFKSLLEDE